MLGRSRRKVAAAAAQRLYEAIMARARTPLFHEKFGVADTIDGRFDLLVLHLYLVLERLASEGPGGAELAKATTVVTFAGFEEALRQLGVSDSGMSRRIKAMANAFYGRLEAYGNAAGDPSQLTQALLRNLYRADHTREIEASRLAHYVIAARRQLTLPGMAATLLTGTVDFGPLPAE